MAKVVQCRLVAVVLAVVAMTVTGAACCCCCWSPVTSSYDVIILLATGTVCVHLSVLGKSPGIVRGSGGCLRISMQEYIILLNGWICLHGVLD